MNALLFMELNYFFTCAYIYNCVENDETLNDCCIYLYINIYPDRRRACNCVLFYYMCYTNVVGDLFIFVLISRYFMFVRLLCNVYAVWH